MVLILRSAQRMEWTRFRRLLADESKGALREGISMQKAKRGFARKTRQEDGTWLLTVGKTGEEDRTRTFEGTEDEADQALLAFYRESFQA